MLNGSPDHHVFELSSVLMGYTHTFMRTSTNKDVIIITQNLPTAPMKTHKIMSDTVPPPPYPNFLRDGRKNSQLHPPATSNQGKS
jgi:hypothetical protein